MPALPENILTQLTNFTHSPRLQRCWLVADDLPGIGAGGSETPPWGGGAIGFQYWPESLSDTRASEWAPKNIPGGSHPLYQWTNGGERGLSFVAAFTTDTNPGDHFGMDGVEDAEDAIGASASYKSAYSKVEEQPLSGLNLKTRDIDLRSVVSWLRWFTYPSYQGASGGLSNRVFEPAKALLVMPNTGLGYDGTDYVRCVMRGCQVTYQAWFPNGFPRIIEVSLEFVEVVQSSTRVSFQGRGQMHRSQSVKGHLGPTTDTSR